MLTRVECQTMRNMLDRSQISMMTFNDQEGRVVQNTTTIDYIISEQYLKHLWILDILNFKDPAQQLNSSLVSTGLVVSIHRHRLTQLIIRNKEMETF